MSWLGDCMRRVREAIAGTTTPLRELAAAAAEKQILEGVAHGAQRAEEILRESIIPGIAPFLVVLYGRPREEWRFADDTKAPPLPTKAPPLPPAPPTDQPPASATGAALTRRRAGKRSR